MLQFVNCKNNYIFAKDISIQFFITIHRAGFSAGLIKQSYMYKKILFALLFAALSFVTSCVDANYDVLNKEITTDVKIEGNTVALPVGGLKPVILNDLINLDEIEMLVKDSDGVYAIKMEDTIKLDEGIEEISLKIDPFEYTHSIEDFGKADIESVSIDSMSRSAEIKAPVISVADLNKHLPHLCDAFPTSINIPGLESMLQALNIVGEYTHTFEEPFMVNTGEKEVACSIEYSLPGQIETISSIRLGSENDKNGALVKVNVTNPKVLEDCSKALDISVVFPENFKLAKNSDVEGNYIIEGNSVTLAGFEPSGSETVFSFYITDITDIDQYITDGVIKLDEVVKYSIIYTIKEGSVLSLKKGVTKEDFAFDVNFDVALSFQNVAGKTKDVKVDFPGIELDFNAEFSNLKNVSMVNSVEFDENASCIEFKTSMDKEWFSAFELKEGYALKISFPKGLIIDLEKTVITSGSGETVDVDFVYNESDGVYVCYVSDLSILSNSNWKLALEKLELNIPVVDGNCTLSRKVDIKLVNMDNPSESGAFYLKGLEMESMVGILDKLNNTDKKAKFKLQESELVISNAVVSTTAISASLNEKKPFDIKEEIPSEIKRIDRIGFKEDVLVTMVLEVEGLESMNSDVYLDFDMSLPSFLKLMPYDNNSGVTIDGGLLSMHTKYNPSSKEPLEIKLWCCGIDFMNEEFGFDGYEPFIEDGKSYINYSDTIYVNGEASIKESELHSTMLKHDASFKLTFDVNEIVVKSFQGLYSKEMPSVKEVVGLDLGEELDFLKDASLTLADPQIELVLTNTVGVPVDVKLHIQGKKENGDVIQTSEIETTLTIAPAEYDEAADTLCPVKTKYFLTASGNGKAGYENVKIENLGNLLAEIPDSLSLNVVPVIREGAGVTHYVDVSQSIRLDAAYSVVVPFKFNDLHFCYSDTISELKVDIDETMDMLSNVSVLAKMDVINTIPLGLSLEIVPLDENGKKIEDVEIDKIEILAGEGKNLLGADNVTVAEGLTVQPFEFSIKSASGDISSLDRLAFTIEALSNSVTGSVGLKGEQGVKISNIVFEVSGDIEVDLRK